MTTLTQVFRNNEARDKFTLDKLFSNLINKLKRYKNSKSKN